MNDDDDEIVLTVGSADPGDDHPDHPAAVLWIPDCDGRYGWREYRIEKPDPPRRRLGFLP